VGQGPTFLLWLTVNSCVHKMDQEKRIAEIIKEPLLAMGFDLVRVQISGTERLQLGVMIDRLDQQSVALNDCVAASKHISTLLDVEDPIKSSYVLEVTSPGLDRLLFRHKDFKRFVNHQIKIKTYEPIDNRKRFQGILTEVEDKLIKLEYERIEGSLITIEISYKNIRQAKLVPDYKHGKLT
jgi:ribosome maturation factor RimP